jgi:mannose-6-phosphate isomerase-like protein (cupin superfamily)
MAACRGGDARSTDDDQWSADVHIEKGKWLRGDADSVDRRAVAQDWRERGFSCDLWVDPPGQRWEGFVHSTDELVVLMEGELEVGVGEESARVAVGDEWFIPEGAVHSVRNVGKSTARWLYGYQRTSSR